MSLEDYALNLVLVALVVRQLRGKKLTPFGLLWPVAVVVWAAITYLHGVTTMGNDIIFVVSAGLLGALLGCACALATRVFRRPDGTLIGKATGLAAALWVAGTGARMGFALYAEHGGGNAIASFSTAHDITGAQAWTAALLLMALAEVIVRTIVLAIRAQQAARAAPGARLCPAGSRLVPRSDSNHEPQPQRSPQAPPDDTPAEP